VSVSARRLMMMMMKNPSRDIAPVERIASREASAEVLHGSWEILSFCERDLRQWLAVAAAAAAQGVLPLQLQLPKILFLILFSVSF
jgi:hypothetical protein